MLKYLCNCNSNTNVIIDRKGKMIKKVTEMSSKEVMNGIRELQSKESEMYNQIQDIKKLFAELEIKFDAIKPLTFREIAEYRHLKERFQEMQEASKVSDSEIKEFGETEEKNRKEAEINCDALDKTARRLMRISVKIKNEIQIAQKSQ